MKKINLVLTVIGMSGLFLGFTAQARELHTLTLREHAIIAAANAILEEHQSQSYEILVDEIGEQKATGFIENILVPRDIPKVDEDWLATGTEPHEVAGPLRDLEPSNGSGGGCGGGGRTQNCTNEKKFNPQASFKLYSRSPSQETGN